MTTPPNPPPYGPPPGGYPPPPPQGWGQQPQQAPPPMPGWEQQAAQPPAWGQQVGGAQYPGGQPGGAQYPGGQPGWEQQPPPVGQPAFTGPPLGFPAGQQNFPPPPKSGTSNKAKALIGAVALGIVGIVVVGFIAGIGSPGRAEAGDCIKVNSVSASNADVDTIDCNSPEAAFKVAVNLDSSRDSCPAGDYSEYSDRGGRRSNGFKLCLVFNAREGDCFKQEGTIVAGKTTKVTCDSRATHKVTKVASTQDENACQRGETVFVYSQPATTICMAENE